MANARIRTVGETTHTDDNTLLKEDISSVMRQRAVDGYGLKVIKKHCTVIHDVYCE